MLHLADWVEGRDPATVSPRPPSGSPTVHWPAALPPQRQRRGGGGDGGDGRSVASGGTCDSDDPHVAEALAAAAASTARLGLARAVLPRTVPAGSVPSSHEDQAALVAENEVTLVLSAGRGPAPPAPGTRSSGRPGSASRWGAKGATRRGGRTPPERGPDGSEKSPRRGLAYLSLAGTSGSYVVSSDSSCSSVAGDGRDAYDPARQQSSSPVAVARHAPGSQGGRRHEAPTHPGRRPAHDSAGAGRLGRDSRESHGGPVTPVRPDRQGSLSPDRQGRPLRVPALLAAASAGAQPSSALARPAATSVAPSPGRSG